MHDALFADQGRLEDPHLWDRAERLGLDLARFDADRRGAAWPRGSRPTSRAGSAPGPDDARRCSSTASAMPGARTRRSGRGWRTSPLPRAYSRPMPAPPATEDARLVERLRTDETGEAMRALYRTYGGELLGFAQRSLGDRGAAEEIVQEVFLRAWRHAGRYDAERADGPHLALPDRTQRDHRRAPPRRRAARGGHARGRGAGRRWLDRAGDAGWQVAAALERLTPEHRQMIRMAQFRGMSMREIARARRACPWAR